MLYASLNRNDFYNLHQMIYKFDCTSINFSSDINECASSPCKNGGTCHDDIDSYTCTCIAGYEGHNCETSKAWQNNNL